jgi:hypothetical protein
MFSVLFTLIFTLYPSLAFADYEPYKFQCTYHVSGDGDFVVTSKVDLDQDDKTFSVRRVNADDEVTKEFSEVYVIGHDDWDKLSDEEREAIEKIEKILKIKRKAWFTVTQLIFNFGPGQMTFYKFNARKSHLGVGIHSVYDLYEAFLECR